MEPTITFRLGSCRRTLPVDEVRRAYEELRGIFAPGSVEAARIVKPRPKLLRLEDGAYILHSAYTELPLREALCRLPALDRTAVFTLTGVDYLDSPLDRKALVAARLTDDRNGIVMAWTDEPEDPKGAA